MFVFETAANISAIEDPNTFPQLSIFFYYNS